MWRSVFIGRSIGVFLLKQLNTISSLTSVFRCNISSSFEIANILPSNNSSAHESTKILKSFSDIPGPKGLPIVGTLLEYMRNDGDKFNKLFEVMQQRAEEYGPIYKEQIGSMTFVIISDPKEYMNVIRVDGKYPQRMIIKPVVHYLNERRLPLGTIHGQGEEWYRPRVILAKKMLRPKELVKYIQPMNDIADDFIQRLKNLSSKTVPNLKMELFNWSLESIGIIVLEERIGCFLNPPPQLAEAFLSNISRITKYKQKLLFGAQLYTFFPTTTWNIFEKLMDNNEHLALTLIRKKLNAMEKRKDRGNKNGENSAFLTHLMTHFCPVEAVCHATDVIGGAIETTSHAMLWLLYGLARHPLSQNTLYLDIRRAMANDEAITEEHLQRMPFIKACLKETFRLYPVANSTSRKISKDISVCGYHVPKGTICQANLYAMGQNKEVFSDPRSYKPERWLRENKETRLSYLSNLAFGHGPRMCLGRRIAEQELYILLAKIILNFRLEFHEAAVNPTQAVVSAPDTSLNIQFISRHL